jgi:hypothetical protein
MLKQLKIGLVFLLIALSLYMTNGVSSGVLYQNQPFASNTESGQHYFTASNIFLCVLPQKETSQVSGQNSAFPILSKYLLNFTQPIELVKPKWVEYRYAQYIHPIVSSFFRLLLYPFHYFF